MNFMRNTAVAPSVWNWIVSELYQYL